MPRSFEARALVFFAANAGALSVFAMWEVLGPASLVVIVYFGGWLWWVSRGELAP